MACCLQSGYQHAHALPIMHSFTHAHFLQAASFVFEHAAMPTGMSNVPVVVTQLSAKESRVHYGDMLGRESVALNLLTDIVMFCASGEKSGVCMCVSV